MIGVEDEQHLQGPLQHRVDPVLPGQLEHHLQEVPAVAQLVVGVGVRRPHRVAVSEGRHRRHLGDEPEDLGAAVLGVVDVLRVRVERRQRGHGRDEHPHRVGVVAEGPHQLLDVLVDDRVVGDVVHPSLVLRPGGKLAVEDEVRRLQVVALLGQLLDRIAPIKKDALVPVDEGDLAAAGGGVGEGGVVGHQPEVVGPRLDLPQVERADRPVLDGDLVGLARPVVGDGEGVLAHDRPSEAARPRPVSGG